MGMGSKKEREEPLLSRGVGVNGSFEGGDPWPVHGTDETSHLSDRTWARTSPDVRDWLDYQISSSGH